MYKEIMFEKTKIFSNIDYCKILYFLQVVLLLVFQIIALNNFIRKLALNLSIISICKIYFIRMPYEFNLFTLQYL